MKTGDNNIKTPSVSDMAKWMPTLALADTLCFATMAIALVLFKRLGLANEEITMYSSLLFTPWLLRPMLDRYLPHTHQLRLCIAALEAIEALMLITIAFTLGSGLSTAMLAYILWLMSICGAFHGAEVHRYYQQSVIAKHRHAPHVFRFIGFLLAMVACQGFLVAFAGNMEVLTRTIRYSWSLVFYLLGGTFLILALIHSATLRATDHSAAQQQPATPRLSLAQHFSAERIRRLFDRANLPMVLILTTLIPEGLTSQVSQLFLIDARHNGGLGLSPSEYGLVQGTLGALAFVAGAATGLAVWRKAKRQYVLPVWAIVSLTLPVGLNLYLSMTMTTNLLHICICSTLRLMAAGFGASVIYYTVADYRGNHSSATALVALPLIVAGFFSGIMQESMGYRTFFTVLLSLCPVALAFVAALYATQRKRRTT